MLTPKGRKTAKTIKPLHLCSNVEPVGVVSKVERERKGRKDRQIWNDTEFVLPEGVVRVTSHILDPHLEYERMNAIQGLNKWFFKLVYDQTKLVPPLMSFERWLSRAKLHDHEKAPLYDPVLPTSQKLDTTLISDLVRASISQSDAEKITLLLIEESKRLAIRISNMKDKKTDKQVHVVQHKHTFDICFGKKLLKINIDHYEKLKIQFLRYGLSEEEAKDKEMGENQLALFHKALFVMLARYHGIQGHGYQAACGEKVFEEMHTHFGVTMECFGSPLNSYFNHFCSAFVDTDWCFGAVSNFFDFQPLSGSFECNPPFVPAVMFKTIEHIDSLLSTSESQNDKKPLCFIVVVPGWLDDPAIIALENSMWNRKKYLISKEEHGFCDGAQHQRKDRFRESPFDTFIYVLQNSSAMQEYPPTKAAECAIRNAMVLAMPTEAMKQRRLKEGRGFADADGCGSVYKGKRKKRKNATNLAPVPKKRKLHHPK